jgi:acetyl esterase/lipase
MSSVIRKVMDALSGEIHTSGPADADMQEVLDQLAAMNGKAIETLDVATARRQPTPADAVTALLRKRGRDASVDALVPGISSVDRTIDGATGPLQARVYTPAGTGPFPVVVYFHGGGWVIADKAVYDGGARGLSKASGAIVVSVDYRRSPEAKFPAAWDDAFAAYQWVCSNAASIHGDPTRLALAGESAGGNLAIATAIAARDHQATRPLAVLAVYPVGQTGDMETDSYVDSAEATPLNKAMIGWFVDKLLGSPADKGDVRLDLVHADLARLPPITIINADIDPLRSDGELLEAALSKSGVTVTRKVYDGVTHEFFGMAAVVAKARAAQAFAGEQLRKQLHSRMPPEATGIA